MLVHMLASWRDALARLIQWGDDPSSTRYWLRSFQGFEAHKLFGGVSDLSHLIQVKAQFCVNKNRFFVLTTRVAETEPESSRRLTTGGQKQHRTIPLADFATGKAPMRAAKLNRPGLGGSQSPPSSGGRSRLQRSAEPHADHVAD
jgi:hypothetical protein